MPSQGSSISNDLKLSILPALTISQLKVVKQGKTQDFAKQLWLTEKGQVELELQELLEFGQVEAELLQMPDINQSSGQVLINPTCKTTNPSGNVKERSVKQVLFQPHSAQKWQENTPVQFLMRMESGLLVPLSGDNIMPCKLMNSTDHHHQHSFTSIFKFIPALDKPSKSLFRNWHKSDPHWSPLMLTLPREVNSLCLDLQIEIMIIPSSTWQQGNHFLKPCCHPWLCRLWEPSLDEWEAVENKEKHLCPGILQSASWQLWPANHNFTLRHNLLEHGRLGINESSATKVW